MHLTFVGQDSSVDIAASYGVTMRGSNPGGDQIFRSRPERPWSPPSLLYNGQRVFLRGTSAGAWSKPLTSSIAEVKEWVELYTSTLPLGLYEPFFLFTCILLSHSINLLGISFVKVRAEFGAFFLKQSVGYTEIRHKSLLTLKTHRHWTCLILNRFKYVSL